MAGLSMKRVWETIRTGFWGGVLGLVLVMPVVVYIQVFGNKITDDHERWGQMGSALSGIYGPILTILTVSLLIHQLRLQQQTNKHMFDQAYLQEARADIEFYLMRLAEVLNRPLAEGQLTDDVLRSKFERATVEQLADEQLKRFAQALNYDAPHLQGMWSAIYSIFAGLKANNEHPYSSQFSSAQQKAYAMLSFQTCVALDNYIYCLSEQHVPRSYQFSRGLPSD
jgi:hypothetical protein